jgi:hypothetical protein
MPRYGDHLALHAHETGYGPVVTSERYDAVKMRLTSLSTARGAARTSRAPGAPAALWSAVELFFSRSTRLRLHFSPKS